MFDIIIQAGQSNSEGCGFGEVDRPFEPDERIWYFNNDFTVKKAEEAFWDNKKICNFSLSFAQEYIKSGLLQPSRNLLIVRAAVGGTGFLDGRWGLNDELYIRMIEMTESALALNKDNRLVAFLWHQGESDAGLNASFETHYNNLKSLVQTVRNRFDCSLLPFVAADFVHDWKNENLSICEPVIRAIKAVCSELIPAAFVETAELKSNAQTNGGDDTIHFCRASLMKLGQMYFDEFIKLKLYKNS